MPVQEAVWWALVGSGLIEASDLYSAIHASRGFPWKRRGHLELRPYLVSVLIRLTVGTGLTAALAATSQVATATSAFAVGVAAPKILEQIARRVPQSLAVGEERRDFGTHADQAVGLTSDPALGALPEGEEQSRAVPEPPSPPQDESLPLADDKPLPLADDEPLPLAGGEPLTDGEPSEGGGSSAS